MKDKRKSSNIKRRREEPVGECFFCKEKKGPSFLEYDMLSKFTSERGKILARSRSGICARHQRKLTAAIKRARYIGFLPYVTRPE
jgi:small subunit ribosomal protein S18